MLVISLNRDEPFKIEHNGVEVWISLRKDGSKFRAYIAGPSDMRVSRPWKHEEQGQTGESFDRLFNGNRGRN